MCGNCQGRHALHLHCAKSEYDQNYFQHLVHNACMNLIYTKGRHA